MLTRIADLTRLSSRAVLDALLPPQCLSCHDLVDRPGNLCAACFGRFTFLAPPQCDRCGLPLEPPVIDEVICGACLQDPPSFERARAVFAYNDESKALVLRLKHGDRTESAVHLAKWMHRAGADVLGACDLIIPVPLHRWRLLSRMYNQASLLANKIGQLAEKPVLISALVRVKATPTQGGLDRDARRRNVSKAFEVKKQHAISGRRILLIDDVLTTGATANACAGALLSAGAATVSVLVLARVPRSGDAAY